MSSATIMRFEEDHWSPVPAVDIEPGDVIFHQGNLIDVTSRPTVENGKVKMSGRLNQVDADPIVLAVGEGWKDRQATVAVMDYVNAGCRDFGDGTQMIAELEAGPGAIFSPRLPVEQLETWCHENIAKFEAFFEAHESALDNGDIVKMEVWW